MLVYMTLSQFKKTFGSDPPIVFESKKRVIAPSSGILFCAFKVTKDKVFKHSTPITGCGYPGIASADDKAAMSHEEIVEEIRGLLSDLEDEERKAILEEINSTSKPEAE